MFSLRQGQPTLLLLLWGTVQMNGFASQRWLTFRQALAAGGSVHKGEKGTTVFYADRFVPKGQGEGEIERAIPFLKRFTVFNVQQCDGLPEAMTAPGKPLPEREIIPVAETLARMTGADIRIGGNKAYYAPSPDYIQVPPQQAFHEQINFWRTLYHELGHWSGGASRLNRDLSGRFGTHAYMGEEIIALSAFFDSVLPIRPVSCIMPSDDKLTV